MGLRYRVGQFVQAVQRTGTPPALGSLADLLTPEQRRLFGRMAEVDQRHCLAVAQALQRQGQHDADLLRAALLHDIGKSSAAIRVWERVAHVLMQRLAPSWVGRVGARRPGGFGHGLYVLAHHAHLGAELAAQAGLPAATVALIRGDGDPLRQAVLRQADDTH